MSRIRLSGLFPLDDSQLNKLVELQRTLNEQPQYTGLWNFFDEIINEYEQIKVQEKHSN